MNQDSVGSTCLPGDVVGKLSNESFSIGPGLRQSADSIVATKAGVLAFETELNFYHIISRQKRYVPAVDDLVVGIIVERMGENYKVDIGSAAFASLPILGFEGASKRNRPNLIKGDLVYARVVVANKDMDPELLCHTERNKADGFGQLKDGYMLNCSLGMCRTLLQEACFVLNRLGQEFPFEIAVGHNGRVHVNGVKPARTLLLAQAILNSEFLNKAECESMIRLLMGQLHEEASANDDNDDDHMVEQ